MYFWSLKKIAETTFVSDLWYEVYYTVLKQNTLNIHSL